MKEVKDLSRNVRINSGAFNELKERGWSPQKALDWAIKQIRKKGIKPEAKK